MTPTTRLPLVERLRLLASPAAERWPDYVRINLMVSDGLEAAALIEKQGAVIAALVEAAEAYRAKNIEGIASQFQPTKPEDYKAMGKLAGEIKAAHRALDLALLAAKTLGERE